MCLQWVPIWWGCFSKHTVVPFIRTVVPGTCAVPHLEGQEDALWRTDKAACCLAIGLRAAKALCGADLQSEIATSGVAGTVKPCLCTNVVG